MIRRHYLHDDRHRGDDNHHRHDNDASNIRLSNISLAYRVPAHWCKKISLSGARLQFNVENVATFAFDSKANYDLGGKVKKKHVWGLYLNF